MEMDLDLDPSDVAGGHAPEVEDGHILGDVTIEGERCGICMDVVIDRGVIDCCQHWYCFTCIDNWASITNLCPLCQNEFQLITCVPVYDTIRSNKVEDENLSREDEWCIEGKNNTLSFPSYYIDENAVICLDGDACKMRDGSASIEDPSLDTSIACDSCDIWYHAFCVGFNPEGTSESTWLCPRCVVDKVPADTKMDKMYGTVIHCGPDHANSISQFDDSCRNVSVCVADSGETALVISMHGALDGAEMPSENALPSPQVEKDHMNQSLCSVSNRKSKDAGMASMIVSPDMEEQELNLPLSQKFSILPSDCLEHTKSNSTDTEATNNSSGFHVVLSSCAKPSSESKQMPGQSESEPSLHLGSTVVSVLSDDDMNKDAKDCVTVVQQGNPSEELSRGHQKVLDVDDNSKVTSEKWKDTSSNQVCLNQGDMITDVVTEDSQKKPIFEGSPLRTSEDYIDAHVLNMSPGNPIREDEKLKPYSKKVEVTPDIMRIVKGTNRRHPKVLASSNACNLSSKECETVAGCRLKKIMRRADINEDSSKLVQNLRKEIREAVLKKCNNFEENVFDPKLLAAFRAAMAGATSQPVNKLSTSALKSKKLMLRKGKVRENLTKKIYGNSNGRRKRAWDRDCEVEFWKYRCKRASKPEKIETLKSVLHFLSKSSESLELKQESEFEATSPILNRLYLADTSVFPRKDVIPLAAVASSLELSSENSQRPDTSFENSTSKSSEAKNISSKMGTYSPECKVNMKTESGLASKPASGNVHQRSTMVGGSVSRTSGDKGGKEESGVLSVDVKSDRRKWALQVLARQTANAGGKRTKENLQDNTLFKGSYPLLTQLPADMRPVLATARHNKIPVSVRQTQLYRLTEHFLGKVNLPEICRTAETELAVADAVNIEKNAADRSNSKLVYLNLCSQELLHHSSKSNFDRDTAMNPSSMGSLSERSEQHTDELPLNPAVEEALKNAGLLSDSPPASPIAKSETETDSNCLSGPGNLLEIDSHPELDIYGDFEYELEDEDYIGASNARVLNQKSESVPKVKVLFSTMNVNKPNGAVESEGLDNSNIQTNASFPISCGNDTGNGSFTDDGKPDKSIVLEEALPGAEAEEPSDAECRELYGPDKEPTINDFKHWQYVMPHVANQATDAYEKGDEKLAESSGAIIISHNSSGVEVSHNLPQTGVGREENKSDTCKHLKCVNSVSKKVEAYIKEHVRPLCKSGVITAEQYRWAVSKTTDKVMKYHSKSTNANFLIKEGEKVKKLAEQYVEAAQQNCKGD